jgi:hypothetical protein
VDNLLVVPHNLKALVHDIHALIRAPAHIKNAFEHLHKAGIDTRSGGGGTTIVGSEGRSVSWSGGASTMSPRILRHCRVKWLMCYILVEFLLGHYLNHVLNIQCKSIRSQWVGGDVPNLIHNILKNIKAHWLHVSIQQV